MHSPDNHGAMSMQAKSRKSKLMITLVLITVAALVVLGIGIWKMQMNDSAVKKSQYQAVFLTNGQVYFGKLSSTQDKYIELEDIYYLQVQQAVQPAESDSGDQPKVSLAKLGNELHGPEDQMMISRDQVIFWENLKDDSKVVAAIKENQKK